MSTCIFIIFSPLAINYCAIFLHFALQLLRLYFAEANGLIKGDIFGLRYMHEDSILWCTIVAMQYTVVYYRCYTVCGVLSLLCSILWCTIVAMQYTVVYYRCYVVYCGVLLLLYSILWCTIVAMQYTVVYYCCYVVYCGVLLLLYSLL